MNRNRIFSVRGEACLPSVRQVSNHERNAAGEVGETEVWLDFAKDFGYLDEKKHHDLRSKYDEVSRMLYGMIDKADKFAK